MDRGNALVLASMILAASIVASSFVLKGSIDTATEDLGTVLAEAQAAAPAAGAAAAPAARPGRPEPGKRYEVVVGDAPRKGEKAAQVTIVEFSDFQCPFCRRVNPTLAQVEDEYGGEVQFAFKHLPLAIHAQARGAHQAAEAARLQGKFWEMHDRIFADQRNLSEETYVKYAGEIGLDVDRFQKDMASAAVSQRIDADVAQAGELGITGTPSFFVNGLHLSGAKPFESFKELIDEELAKN